MPLSFEEILLSRPFKFIVGADKVPLVVHETVLAEQSPALAALMRGKMAEGVAGESTWTDVDKETFVQFAQFAYTGDYSIPTGSIVQVVVEAEPLPLDDEWRSNTLSKKDKRLRSMFGEPVPKPPSTASRTFSSLKYPLLNSPSDLYTWKPSIKDGFVEEGVLLAHASLYGLAEKWGVNGLKMLVLSKLHQTLITLCLDAAKIQEVIDLARYVYSDNCTPNLETEIDGLRKLVSLYIAANVEVISEHISFMDLIEDGGAFVRDIWKLVVPQSPSHRMDI